MPTGPMLRGELLGSLQSGEAVFDADPSHLDGHPTVRPHLTEALSRITAADRERIYEEIDFGRIIGASNCVATSDGDDIIFAKRKNRLGWTRFVLNRQPEPCSSVIVVLARDPRGCYILRTAFVGYGVPAEPWDVDARTADSLPFWSGHALVWGFAEIVPGTETSFCPWPLEEGPGAPRSGSTD